jgi:hypothetical protein
MARPKNTLKTVYFNVGLPEDLAVKVKLELYSELEGKIPFGASQEFFTGLVRSHFKGAVAIGGTVDGN